MTMANCLIENIYEAGRWKGLLCERAEYDKNNRENIYLKTCMSKVKNILISEGAEKFSTGLRNPWNSVGQFEFQHPLHDSKNLKYAIIEKIFRTKW